MLEDARLKDELIQALPGELYTGMFSAVDDFLVFLEAQDIQSELNTWA